jgi:hypothetical protein
MYQIDIIEWEANAPDKDGKVITHKESLIDAIKYLINISEPKIGLENFMIIHNLAEALDNVDDKVLKLQSREYSYVKDIMQEKVPAQWAMNKNLATQITKFLQLKEG